MANLKTKYMGIELETPLVAAASSVSGMLDTIKKVEQAGAGALVIRSLFEEQIQFNAQKMEDALSVGSYNYAEALDYFPKIEHGGADEHLMWIEKTRTEVELPLITASLAATRGNQIRAADLLGINRNTLRKKLTELQIDVPTRT